MANRNWASGGKIYSMHVSPVLLDCNFVVDSTNGNGLGIRSLKGPCVASVLMHTSATPAPGNPNPTTSFSPPVGSVDLGTAANFAILAYSAITGSAVAGTVVNGDMGIYPNNLSSVTNFPPSVDNGTIHAADSAANQGRIDGNTAFLACQSLGLAGSTIPSELGGQTLTPGAYQFASGSAGLSLTSGHSTLTFNGAGTYVIYTATTLTTGASGSTDLPVMAFTGGATPSNTFIYWAVGSSATINQSVSSAGAVFYGTVLAYASITATQSSVIDGQLLAVGGGNGAVTLTGVTTLNIPIPAPPTTGGSGVIIVRLSDNYNRSLSGFSAIVSPVSGSPLTSVVSSTAYVIVSLGTASLAQWQAVGLPVGATPAIGAAFVATASASIGGSAAVEVIATAGSGITNIETVGDPNSTIDNTDYQKGAQFILQCYSNGVKAQPADGTVISLAFLLSNSSIVVQGE